MRFIKSWLALSLLLSSTLVFAQSATATLSGSVVDQQDSVVNGVKITVQNDATSLKREVTSNDAGRFVVPVLPPGNYTLTALRDGFAPVKINNIVLNTNDERSLRIQLRPGNVNESVNVTAQTLTNESPATATVVDQKFVENMPLNGRTLQSLVSLTPGVVLGAGDGQLSINGQRGNANYLTIDGVSANIGVSRNQGTSLTVSLSLGVSGQADQNAAGATPGYNALGTTNSLFSIEELQEFTVQTSNTTAAFGRQSGGQIGITTRSGSNDFHGSAYDYWRHETFDARDWFTNASTTFIPKQRLRQHLFGATLSGPVITPRFGEGGPALWKGKDKTFFFFNFEGLRLTQPQSATVRLVPSTAMRNLAGLHPLVSAMLNAYPLPTDESANCARRTTALSTAAWNALPAAQRGAAFYSPVVPAGTLLGACYVDASSSNTSMNAYRIKLDHNFSTKHSLMVRFNSAPLESESFTYSNRTNQNGDTKTFTAGYKTIFSAKVLNEFNLNWSRNTGVASRDLTTLGGAVPFTVTPFLPANAPARNRVSISLPASLTDSGFTLGSDTENVQQQWNFTDNFRWITGNHTLGLGMDYRRMLPQYAQRDYQVAHALSLAQTTPTTRTALDLLTAASPIAGQISIFVFDPVDLQINNFSAYAQDTWKAHKRLTLDFGLRWEVVTPPQGINAPLYTLKGFPDLNNLTLSTEPFFETKYNSFAPRIGAAFQLGHKAGWETTLRGGWGLYYDLGLGSTTGAALQFPYTRSLPTARTFVPFPVSETNLAPPAALSLNPPYTAQSFTLVAPGYSVPRTYQWNFTVDQSIGGKDVVSIAYVANAGRKLLRRYFYGFAATNPPAAGNILPGNANFINARLNVTRNDGNFGDLSDYKGLQVSYLRRLSKGLQVLANYTLSKAEDTGSSDVLGAGGINNTNTPNLGQSNSTNAGDYKGYSDNDRRHIFNAAVTYELPNWRPTDGGLNWLNKILVKGWGTDFNYKYQSAAPLSLYYTYSDRVSGISFPYRLDVVAGQPLWLEDAAAAAGRRLNPAAFALPAGVGAGIQTAKHGNQVRNSMRGFNLYQLDFSLRRTFALTEKIKLQFRGEMFNLTNHPNFAPPINSFGSVASDTGVFTASTTFGRTQSMLARAASGGAVTGGLSSIYAIGGPRSTQFSLKLLF